MVAKDCKCSHEEKEGVKSLNVKGPKRPLRMPAMESNARRWRSLRIGKGKRKGRRKMSEWRNDPTGRVPPSCEWCRAESGAEGDESKEKQNKKVDRDQKGCG
jgi:hypothetical protein